MCDSVGCEGSQMDRSPWRPFRKVKSRDQGLLLQVMGLGGGTPRERQEVGDAATGLSGMGRMVKVDRYPGNRLFSA